VWTFSNVKHQDLKGEISNLETIFRDTNFRDFYRGVVQFENDY